MPESLLNCVLAAQIVASNGQVFVDYRFHNGSGKQAYIFNLQHRRLNSAGEYAIERNLAVVEVRHSVVTIGKELVPVPEDISVERPNIPCVTEVPPGTTFQESFVLDEPLKSWTPYRNPARTTVTRSLPGSFELGFFLAPARPRSYRMLSDGTSLCPPAFDLKWQYLIRDGTANVLVEMDD